eukprot:Gb_17284 [translate_table: standard]
MRWRDRFLFCAEAIYKAQTEIGEIKGYYLNATVACLIIAETMAYFFTFTAQCMQLLTDKEIMVNLKENEKSLWVLLIYYVMILLKKTKVVVFISLKIRYLCQFGGGTLGYPWGNAPGAVANRVALESCVQARNEGRDLAREGNEVIREASKWSPELAAACENKSVYEGCGYHLQMSSSDRIKLLIDHGTRHPMDEDMAALDLIQFHSEDELHIDRITFYQIRTGLTDAIQIGIGRLNGIPIAIGVMDFKFMGGSMGSVVGEKMTCPIEHATKESLPLIMVSASGGARMQEGSFSLIQMAKISSALYIHQLEKNLLYVSILTYPTTGGVTASFGMLGDIIIIEPKAYMEFADKRVIEQTLVF